MTVKDKSVNAWQIGILLFILLFANKILVLPSLLYDGAKVEAFFIPVILFALELGLLVLFYKVKNKVSNTVFCRNHQRTSWKSGYIHRFHINNGLFHL